MNKSDLDELREEIRVWSRRPPATSGRTARAIVQQAIEPASRWGSLLVAAAATALVGIGVALVLLHQPAGARDPAVAGPERAVSGSDRSLLVYELSSGTTMYVALTSPGMGTSIESGNG